MEDGEAAPHPTPGVRAVDSLGTVARATKEVAYNVGRAGMHRPEARRQVGSGGSGPTSGGVGGRREWGLGLCGGVL